MISVAITGKKVPLIRIRLQILAITAAIIGAHHGYDMSCPDKMRTSGRTPSH